MKRIIALPLLLSFCLSGLSGVVMGEDTASSSLFTWKDKEFKLDDLPASLQQAYYDIEMKAKESKEQLLDEALLEQYIQELAQRQHKATEEVRAELLKVKPATEEQIKSLYEETKDRIHTSYDDVKAQIKQYIEQTEIMKKREALIAEQKATGKFSSKLMEPVKPMFHMNVAAFPSKGSSKPVIQLVEFADYRCVYCKQAKDALQQLAKEFADKIQIVSVDYPLLDGNENGVSTLMAQGAYCAQQQGKYWDYNKLAFQQQSSLDNNSPEKIAQQLKLNIKSFTQCMALPESEQFVQHAKDLGKDYAIYATPTFFVNGQKVAIKTNFEDDIRSMVKSQLQTIKNKG
ncbi:hypothetical protein CI610_00937 [invertebrate metagenome]|uniref:Thioredoxin-like fold domain-containing protein n=1 Tax=invertebrate metagenome TaxID=1711999 RepID=A0A2H9TA16_9ZZZZ